MPSSDKQTQTQAQNSSTAPWTPAQPLLQDILSRYSSMNTDVTGAQTSALNNLTGAASGIPNFGASSSDAIKNLFSSSTAPQVGMLSDAYRTLQGNIGGTASGAELDPYSTPGFSDALTKMSNDITNRTKAVYAGAGRDPSGAGSFAGSLGRGLTEGLAPTIANQFNTNNANRFAAANNLFQAGGSTAGAITGQNQVPLTNASTAIGMLPAAATAYTAPGAAQLTAANAAYQQPWTNLAALLNPAAGIAGLGSQSSGTGTAQTVQPQSTSSNVIGGASAGIGLLSLLSDERAKTEIEPIGMLNDGQKVVRFRYHGDAPMRIGLLAQDVAEVEPDAVSNIGGMLAVDHRRATERAAELGRAA